jgi:phosphoglycolate phosphatase
MRRTAVLFDLDGTLLDTLQDVAAAANAALRRCGFAEHSLSEYRYLLGGGVRRLFHSALPEDVRTPENMERCIAAFREEYRAAWNVHTRPYPGIPELIAALQRRGIPMAVLSNKPHDFTRQCIQAHFPDGAAGPPSPLGIGPFAVVLGERAGIPPKPDPAGAVETAELLDVPSRNILYLGDTSIDMQTARAAGMRPIGVLWGFRDREELVSAGAQAVLAVPQDLLPLMAES